MSTLAEMNCLAEEIVSRDNGPNVQVIDTAVYDPDKSVQEPPYGQYQHERTSCEGIATYDEFVGALYGKSLTGIAALNYLVETYTDAEGSPIIGYVTPDRAVALGTVANSLTFVLRRPSDEQINGQAYRTYAGSVWLPVWHEPATLLSVPLLSLTRRAQLEQVRVGYQASSIELGQAALYRAGKAGLLS
jgi:hypothetical protein